MTGKTVAVFGATGTSGGGVARELVAAGHKVRAITRDIAGDKAKAMAGQGAELVVADLNDRSTIRRAIEGVDAVYLAGPALANRWDIGQAVQGINVADACAEVRPAHFIYQSALAGDARGVLSVGGKRAIEERIAELDLPATILRPGWFMENFLKYFPIERQDGKLIVAMAMPSEKEFGLISAEDIGRVAVAVINNPVKYIGAEIDLVSDVLSVAGMAGVIGDEVGIAAVAVEVPLEAIEQFWPEGLGLYRWLSTRTTRDSTDALSRVIDEPVGFRAWVRDNLAPTLKARFAVPA
jgi:uncharacterized protein YbjT (DUF2867 family)